LSVYLKMTIIMKVLYFLFSSCSVLYFSPPTLSSSSLQNTHFYVHMGILQQYQDYRTKLVLHVVFFLPADFFSDEVNIVYLLTSYTHLFIYLCASYFYSSRKDRRGLALGISLLYLRVFTMPRLLFILFSFYLEAK